MKALTPTANARTARPTTRASLWERSAAWGARSGSIVILIGIKFDLTRASRQHAPGLGRLVLDLVPAISLIYGRLVGGPSTIQFTSQFRGRRRIRIDGAVARLGIKPCAKCRRYMARRFSAHRGASELVEGSIWSTLLDRLSKAVRKRQNMALLAVACFRQHLVLRWA